MIKSNLEKYNFIKIITPTWRLANIIKIGKNNTIATSRCLGDHVHMEICDRRTLVIPHCIGDLLLMAIGKTTDNI